MSKSVIIFWVFCFIQLCFASPSSLRLSIDEEPIYYRPTEQVYYHLDLFAENREYEDGLSDAQKAWFDQINRKAEQYQEQIKEETEKLDLENHNLSHCSESASFGLIRDQVQSAIKNLLLLYCEMSNEHLSGAVIDRLASMLTLFHFHYEEGSTSFEKKWFDEYWVSVGLPLVASERFTFIRGLMRKLPTFWIPYQFFYGVHPHTNAPVSCQDRVLSLISQYSERPSDKIRWFMHPCGLQDSGLDVDFDHVQELLGFARRYFQKFLTFLEKYPHKTHYQRIQAIRQDEESLKQLFEDPLTAESSSSSM